MSENLCIIISCNKKMFTSNTLRSPTPPPQRHWLKSLVPPCENLLENSLHKILEIFFHLLILTIRALQKIGGVIPGILLFNFCARTVTYSYHLLYETTYPSCSKQNIQLVISWRIITQTWHRAISIYVLCTVYRLITRQGRVYYEEEKNFPDFLMNYLTIEVN